MDTLVYSITEEQTDTLYINLTNSCTNNCRFCIRTHKSDVCGHEMHLAQKHTVEDIINQFKTFDTPKTVVFCGYGEPTLELDLLKGFARYLRKNHPEIKIRVNTNGHANCIYKRNVVDELKGLVDEFSVSLNASNEKDYVMISQPKVPNAYKEVQDFIKSCVDADINTTASVVSGYENFNPNIEECNKIANELGAKLKVREYILNGY